MTRNQNGLDLVSTIKCCEVCGNKNLESVLNLGLHPLCDDLIEIEIQECAMSIQLKSYFAMFAIPLIKSSKSLKRIV